MSWCLGATTPLNLVKRVNRRAQNGGYATRDVEEPDADRPRDASRLGIRKPRKELVTVNLSSFQSGLPVPSEVPDSGGPRSRMPRPANHGPGIGGDLEGSRSLGFHRQRRLPLEDIDQQDAAFAFQVEMSVEPDRSLFPRPNLHGLDSNDWDERLADLHYSDITDTQ